MTVARPVFATLVVTTLTTGLTDAAITGP